MQLTLEGDEKTGANIILKALEAPLFRIAANAGLEGAVIINKVRESEPGVGFDALNEKYVDMVDAGYPGSCKGYKKRSSERNKRCIYSAYNRICCCKHQRRCSGNASRRPGNGHDVIKSPGDLSQQFTKSLEYERGSDVHRRWPFCVLY